MRSALLVVLLIGCGRVPLVQPSRPLHEATLFTNVRVFDGVADVLSPPRDVLVLDGRIAAIGEVGGTPHPPGARVDGTGRVLLPGLYDGHVHLGATAGDPPWLLGKSLPDVPAEAAALLYSGVTTAVLAGHEVDGRQTNNDVLARRYAGPRVLGATRILCAVGGHPMRMFKVAAPGPVGAIFARLATHPVSGTEQAYAAAAEEAARPGVHHLKAVFHSMPPGAPQLTLDELKAIIAGARAAGVPAFVHVGTPQGAVDAAEAGAAVLMHTPWEGRFTREQADRVRATGVKVVTTSHLWAATKAVAEGQKHLTPLEARVVAKETAEALAQPPPRYDVPADFEGELQRAGDYDANAGANVLMLREAGVTLIAGTDTGVPGVFPGAELHEELKSLVALGIPPAEVLKMATSVPASVYDPGSRRGVIAVGAVADLLLVDGDPLTDIADLDRIAGVWLKGERADAQW